MDKVINELLKLSKQSKQSRIDFNLETWMQVCHILCAQQVKSEELDNE